MLTTAQVVCWELEPGNPTLEVIYQPEVMEAAQKELMEQQSGPLTNISSTQGFFPYKLFASDEEQKDILKSVEESIDKVTPFQRKQYQRTLEHLKVFHHHRTTLDLLHSVLTSHRTVKAPICKWC